MQNITIMRRIEVCYTACRMGTQTVENTLTGFQGLKHCIQYLDSHLHKPIFIFIFILMDQISSYLYGAMIKLNLRMR